MGRYFIMLSFCSLGIYFIKLFRDFFAALAKLSDVKIILPSLHWNSENFLLNGQILYFSAQWADTLLCYLFAPWAFTLLRIYFIKNFTFYSFCNTCEKSFIQWRNTEHFTLNLSEFFFTGTGNKYHLRPILHHSGKLISWFFYCFILYSLFFFSSEKTENWD